MKLKLCKDIQVKDGIMIVNVGEEVDHHACDRLRERTDRIIENQNIYNIIFDFSSTRFMDSSGIGLIIGRYKKTKLMGGNVILTNMSSVIDRIYKMSGIYKLVKKTDTLDQALSELK